jgi:NAD-dependent protein deacetylase/lipoamidase
MVTTMDDAKIWVSDAARISVLTGAGISTDSGIPDFRGPNGVWTKNPAAQRMVTIADYLADPAVRTAAWQERLRHPAWSAEPGPGHRALVTLERDGRLRAIATQNIDGLHQAAGNDPALVLELHGTLREAVCLSCGRRTPMREALARVEAGEPDPPCLACGGIQRSATVAFGQSLDPAVLAAAVAAAREADLFLAVGTSLTVQPAANLCAVALDAGARLVIVNAQPTPYDPFADAVLSAPIAEVLPAIVGA